VLQCLHRDRGVIVGSIRTLVELGDERAEQLALAEARRRLPAHRLLQALGEVLAEQLPVVRHGEDRPGHLADQPADHAELDALPQRMRLRDGGEPHAATPFAEARSAASPLRSRFRPAPSAAASVTSKITSSSWPCAFSCARSSSVILYAECATRSTCAASSGGSAGLDAPPAVELRICSRHSGAVLPSPPISARTTVLTRSGSQSS